jgi:WD40 repeat protein
VPSTARLLTTLVGHMSSITDLHYSYAGDRIVTASQKDGNARIWSFGDGSRSRVSQGGHLRNRFLDPKQIVLRLSNVNVTGAGSAQVRPSRRRGGSSTNNATTSVTCDVAVWTSDDTKIITSQSCPAKSNSQDIVPGSQLILVWDSWSGNCLLAIKQAHSQQCPVVISHPLEPSIMCSAGADGVAKVWDLENGRCLFYHKNVVDMGPIAQNNERGRESGYLDGAFDPHGHHLLLTDDNGRITIFDCLKGPSDILQQNQPAWMTEQYFANDYYELFYNTNGYCVERGSEQPPHLAPRAARCNHAGSAWSDDVSETFRMIKGPSPLSEISSASERTMLRAKMQAHLPGNDYQRRAVVMMDFDPDRTVQVTGAATMVATLQNTIVTSLDTELVENGATGRTRTTSSGRSLSSNYRWRDYDDLIHEEGLNDAGDIDVGDEEFVPRGVADDDDDPSDGLLSESEFLSDDGRRSVSRRSTRNRGATNARSQRANRRDNERARTEVREAPQYQPTRTSARRLTRTNDEESDDDEGFIEEVLSTNNAPTGPFADDYNVDGHLFKLASLSARVNRAWLLRTESSSSYKGRKVYSPQVGDSVVYIPRAHADTIREFPTLKAPWKNWPSGTSWPIVRCRVVNVRYRFPYKDYFRRTAET